MQLAIDYSIHFAVAACHLPFVPTQPHVAQVVLLRPSRLLIAVEGLLAVVQARIGCSVGWYPAAYASFAVEKCSGCFQADPKFDQTDLVLAARQAFAWLLGNRRLCSMENC